MYWDASDFGLPWVIFQTLPEAYSAWRWRRRERRESSGRREGGEREDK
jgi:hypothetical protein